MFGGCGGFDCLMGWACYVGPPNSAHLFGLLKMELHMDIGTTTQIPPIESRSRFERGGWGVAWHLCESHSLREKSEGERRVKHSS